jgi:hypothetical protein
MPVNELHGAVPDVVGAVSRRHMLMYCKSCTCCGWSFEPETYVNVLQVAVSNVANAVSRRHMLMYCKSCI